LAGRALLPSGLLVYDLTRGPIGPGTPVYPGDPRFEAEAYATPERDGYYARRVCMPEHIGTHIDAPAHFAQGGDTVDRLGLGRLVAPGLALQLPGGDDPAGPGDLGEALGGCGLGAGALRGRWLLLRTGGRRLTREAAEMLLDAGVLGLGVDTESPDEEPYPVHRVLLGAGVPILENLDIPVELVCRGFLLVAAPLPLEEGSGAPARVYALLL
jgi:arylformamidase